MTLGRTASNAIKIKTDSPKGLRAVNCACCGGCPTFPDGLCIGAASSPYGSWPAQELAFYQQIETPNEIMCMWATSNLSFSNGALLTRMQLKPDISPSYSPYWWYYCPGASVYWELGVGELGVNYVYRCGEDPYGDYNPPGTPPWPNWGPITKCR